MTDNQAPVNEDAKPDEQKRLSVLRKERTEYLPCKLTESELKDYSKQLANSYDRRMEVEAGLATFKSQAQSQVKSIEGDIGRLSNLVSAEVEYRSVDCEMVYDFIHDEKILTRRDTGEVLRTDKLTNDEKQMELPIE